MWSLQYSSGVLPPHDSDDDDGCNVTIFPTTSEILSQAADYLPPRHMLGEDSDASILETLTQNFRLDRCESTFNLKLRVEDAIRTTFRSLLSNTKGQEGLNARQQTQPGRVYYQ